MVAVGGHGASALRDAIRGPGESRGERHHAAAERNGVDGFDDEVRGIGLQLVGRVAATGGAKRLLLAIGGE